MSAETFLTDFHHVAAIGATPAGGVERQAATPEDKEMRDWFAAFAAERGWPVRVDSIGNMFALVEWHPGADYVLVGSHLDSQPRGGRFDGAYGVIAALHAADRLARRVAQGEEAPKYNLAVVDWFNEEGGRFAPSIMGSSVFAGLMDEQAMLAVTDLEGVTVAEALDAIGYRGSDPRPTPVAYAEIHIEQGRVLEREGIAIGAVDHSWYTQKLDVEVLGEQSHTGATAMADRRDALVAAARVIGLVHDVTGEFEPESIVSSVGYLTLEPNSPIVVPRRVHLVADLRASSPAIVEKARALLLERIADVAREHQLAIEVRDFDVRPVQSFPERSLQITEKAAAGLGIGVRRVNTMAGHDSVPMNRIVPALMMFIPSIDGVSHCERELTSDAQMAVGVDALTEATWELLGGGLDEVTEQRAAQGGTR
ncbi:M20 family metallo-hydrolase [Streptomyces sp. LHD-70]|uniref:M20 family metallo-hydrolase n=1 Tax=Streptomyces sp. LHD-70 TaxID=3072140 RepID=UPI00280C8D92|nr:M20 family metallo-hydrolase [Streptomyces sp. LHD-70]MDQ8706120.1 M20 family metallo-hydrolase [Streptomyces sp. LHD-70]